MTRIVSTPLPPPMPRQANSRRPYSGSPRQLNSHLKRTNKSSGLGTSFTRMGSPTGMNRRRDSPPIRHRTDLRSATAWRMRNEASHYRVDLPTAHAVESARAFAETDIGKAKKGVVYGEEAWTAGTKARCQAEGETQRETPSTGPIYLEQSSGATAVRRLMAHRGHARARIALG